MQQSFHVSRENKSFFTNGEKDIIFPIITHTSPETLDVEHLFNESLLSNSSWKLGNKTIILPRLYKMERIISDLNHRPEIPRCFSSITDN